MKFDIILQCRTRSRRLPNKIFYKIRGNTILEILISNLKKIRQANRIILAISSNENLEIFKKIAKKNEVNLFIAQNDLSENNVLTRFYRCSKEYNSENIVRITPDCPFINIHMIEQMIIYYKKNKLNFLTNNKPRRVPHGFDCEIFSVDVLNKIHRKAKKIDHLEHVTKWIYKKNFNLVKNYTFQSKDYSKLRITLDYLKDYNYFVKNFFLLKKISYLKNPQNILRSLL